MKLSNGTREHFIAIAAAALVGALCLAPAADAAFVLRLTQYDPDNPDQVVGTPVVVVDEGAIGAVSDSGLLATAADEETGVPGRLYYDGQLGPFDLLITNGLSKPLLGDNTRKRIDMFSGVISNVGPYPGPPGILELEMTDTDFVYDTYSGMVKLTSNIGGATDGTVTAQSFFDRANQEFGMDDITSGLQGPDWGTIPGSAFAGYAQAFGDIVAGVPFSISHRVRVEHSGQAFASTTFNFVTQVHTPEPATFAVWGGLGLLGLCCYARRRRAHR